MEYSEKELAMRNRKKEIIQATLELAAKNGMGTVSMQQIADKLGITKASLYNHFSSRDEIVDAMYEFLRKTSKENANIGEIDYDQLTADRTLNTILTDAVNSYKSIVTDPQMFQFYSIIMSERAINSAAAEIMVRETRTMINATKTLFYALQVKRIADFGNVDAAAFSFAMAIHAILEYAFDMERAGLKADWGMMQGYINEFSRIYQAG